jgi:histidinol-phosphate aminotransferase
MSKFTVSDLFRPDVATMEPYTPILPFDVLSEQLGHAPEELVKLDANENLYGPSPGVLQALAAMSYPHIYPDPESRHLRRALADYTGMPMEYLLAGHGADEIIDLVMRLFITPGDAIINCPPTFGMYRFDADVNGARVLSISRRPGFGLDLEGLFTAVANQPSAKLLFIASPNNPDGGLLSADDLRRLLELPLVVVLDEAYVEFAGLEHSRIRWVLQHNNLIVLRTFSKWAGLAGLRVGYGAFPTEIIDLDYLQTHVTHIISERERLIELLSQLPYLRPYPSHANFILCRVVGRDGRALKERLATRGILIRTYHSAGLTDHVRFSVGRPEHTQRLVAELRNV